MKLFEDLFNKTEIIKNNKSNILGSFFKGPLHLSIKKNILKIWKYTGKKSLNGSLFLSVRFITNLAKNKLIGIHHKYFHKIL